MATIIPPPGPWESLSSPGYSLEPVPLPVFSALAAGDLDLASSLTPKSLPPLTSFLITEANRDVWRERLNKVSADSENEPWFSRLIVYKPEPNPSSGESYHAAIVGRIGFHGKPDSRGKVEVGYAVDPTHRRKGHAGAAMRIIIDIARGVDDIKTLRASVAETNLASKRIVESLGMTRVGEEESEKYGWEGVFLLDVSV